MATWTDKVTQALGALAEGRVLPPHVLSIAEPALQASQAGQSQLQAWAESDPEVEAALALRAQNAIASLVDDLNRLCEALRQQRALDWQALIRSLRSHSQELRRAREQAAEVASLGPTSNGFVNRLLRHLDAQIGGREPGHATTSILEQIPDLEDHYVAVLEQFPDDRVRESLHDAIMPMIDALALWSDWSGRASHFDLQRWRGQIVAASHEFDERLHEAIRTDLNQGPTPFGVVNLLLFTLNNGDEGSLAAVASYCEDRLRVELPSDASVQWAAQQLYADLERLVAQCQQQTLGDRADWQRQIAERAHSLSLCASDNPLLDALADSGLPTDVSPTLPPLLRSTLELAERYLQRHIGREQLDAGIAELDRLLARLQVNLERTRPQASDYQQGQNLVDQLDQMLNVLEELAEHPAQHLYRELEELAHGP